MRYYLDPFGCVKNQVDAENMMAHLNNAGWEVVDAENAETADVIIVNSCGFIESAKQESIDAVIEWRKHYPGKKIILAGCLAQRYAKELPEILPEADGFMGVENPAAIVQAAAKLVNINQNAGAFLPVPDPLKMTKQGERPLLSLPGCAYVKISEGCSNRCSYCAIPLIRGSLVSRTITEVVEECRTLLARGIVELNIIGQDIGAFGTDITGDSQLPQLLSAISALEGNFWVRLLYIHPDHFPLQILDIMEKDPRILPYFDIPFQHASPEILAKMNRQVSTGCQAPTGEEKYLALLQTIRTKLPQAVIRSTFLLGFPGETDEDFAALLDFQEKAKLDWLGCFTYSREEGTTAYLMKNQVPAKIALKRKQAIEERQIQITEKNMDRFTGLTLDVLIEEQITAADSSDETLWLGRLYCQAPDIDGTTVITSGEKPLQIGSIVKCKVITPHGFDLEAAI